MTIRSLENHDKIQQLEQEKLEALKFQTKTAQISKNDIEAIQNLENELKSFQNEI